LQAQLKRKEEGKKYERPRGLRESSIKFKGAGVNLSFILWPMHVHFSLFSHLYAIHAGEGDLLTRAGAASGSSKFMLRFNLWALSSSKSSLKLIVNAI